jgi:hypothetical protein
MRVTVGKDLEIVMEQVAVAELATTRIEDSGWKFQRLATQTGFHQRQEAGHTLAVPVRNFAEWRTGVMDIYGFDILRIIIEPLLDLVMPGRFHVLATRTLGYAGSRHVIELLPHGA